MYGWDCFDAIPIDWQLTAVFPTCEHEGEEFVYSEDLWATHGLPELWVSGLGTCGHRVDGRGAAAVLNTMIRRMIAGDLKVGDEHHALFDSGATLRFRVGPPMTGRWYELQTYGASQDAPVSEVTWTCCL